MDHSSYDQLYIRRILNSVKTIAFVGASANQYRPSYMAMMYMQQKGYRGIPINPGLAGQTILGENVYGSISEVPDEIDMVDIFRNAEAAGAITDEALTMPTRPKVIWMQLSVKNSEAAAKAEAEGLKVVMDRCPKMEYGKLCGEWGWMGANSGRITAKRGQITGDRIQSLRIPKD